MLELFIPLYFMSPLCFVLEKTLTLKFDKIKK